MKLDSNDIALIEKYLDGDLSPEEVLLFEEKQEASAEFREAVVFNRRLLGHLEAQQKLALKSELQDMMIQVREERVFPWKTFWVAASVILLVGFIGVLQFQGPSHSQQLFDQYFDPYPVMSVVRGDTPNGLNPLHIYAEGKYEQFIDVLNNGKVDFNGKTGQVQLAYGNALLALAQPERAIEELDKILEGQDHYLDAQWYMALAHLRLKNLDKTRALLKSLIERQSFYKSSARKLLKAIEESA